MRWHEHSGGVRTWHFEMDGRGLLAAVTTRSGGVSAGPYASLNLAFHVADEAALVADNRRRLCQALGVAVLTVPDQQHGNRVVLVDESLSGAGHESSADAEVRLRATDALVTDRQGVALAIMVADCAPVVFHDPVHRSLGVAHVGRGGAVANVIGATVTAMTEAFGTVPSDVEVGVGPSIGQAHYEIGGVQLEQTRAAFDHPQPLQRDYTRTRSIRSHRRRAAAIGPGGREGRPDRGD
jgi:hypothetical protein